MEVRSNGIIAESYRVNVLCGRIKFVKEAKKRKEKRK